MNTPIGTLYHRALKRVQRRAFAYRMDRTPARLALLTEACRLCNTLALQAAPIKARRED